MYVFINEHIEISTLKNIPSILVIINSKHFLSNFFVIFGVSLEYFIPSVRWLMTEDSYNRMLGTFIHKLAEFLVKSHRKNLEKKVFWV